jgi:serine/threonine-protein kinase
MIVGPVLSSIASDVGLGYASGHLVGGRYRLVRRLGAGSMGEVHLVEHTELPRRFALKTLQPRYVHDERARRRFRSEAEVGALLQSPYLVSVFDYQMEHDVPFFVMELLEGEDVRSLLARVGRLNVEAALRVVRDAARGLCTAHRRGIVHRDLKPANLFLSRDDRGERCKVLDFGIARIATDPDCPLHAASSSAGRLIGTLAYMAPEQIRAVSAVDGRADVYSLGAILYEMLSGCRPFEASSDHELMYKVLHEQPAPLDRGDLPCSVVVADLTKRAMSKDPDGRPEMGGLLGEVEHLLSQGASLDLGMSSASSTWFEVPVRPRTRSPRRAQLALTVFVAAGALGALAYERRAATAGTSPAATARELDAVARPVRKGETARTSALVEALAEPQSGEAAVPLPSQSPRVAKARNRAATAGDAPALRFERRNPYKP